MQILENNELIEKINDLHRTYSDDFDLLISAKEDLIGLYEKLNYIKAAMTYKTNVLVNSIIKPNIYNEMLQSLTIALLTNISDLMATYHVPTPNGFYNIGDKADKDFFISYNALLTIAESFMLGKTFEYYKNMSIVRTFKRNLNDLRGKSVYLHIPYKKVLIDDLIKTINIYISGNEFSDIDDKVRCELIVRQKFSYPNFDVKIPKSGDKYTITFQDRESAEKFYRFIMKS